MVWVDAHAHLNSPEFDPDLEETLARARQAGVQQFLCPGYDLPSSRRAVELAARTQGLAAAVGIHPHDSRLYDDEAERQFEAWLSTGQAVAAGEMGLDFHYDNSPRATQRDVLRRQLRLAKRLRVPVVIHNRESDPDMVQILENEAHGLRVMLHAFDGSQALTELGCDKGYFFGIGGFLTFRGHPLAQRVTQLPASALLLETDAPYLSPHPHRGRRNEPARVVAVAARLADLLGMPPEDLATLTTRNYLRFLHGTPTPA